METFWNDLFFKCPLAFTEVLTEKLRDEYIVTVEPRKLDDGTEYFVAKGEGGKSTPTVYPDLFAVQLHFDALGIFIEIGIRRIERTFFVLIEGHTELVNVHHSDRISATKAGIQKAFEIREAQLNQLQTNGR